MPAGAHVLDLNGGTTAVRLPSVVEHLIDVLNVLAGHGAPGLRLDEFCKLFVVFPFEFLLFVGFLEEFDLFFQFFVRFLKFLLFLPISCSLWFWCVGVVLAWFVGRWLLKSPVASPQLFKP